MQKNESEKSEATPEKALPDKVDSHAEKKQRDQAIAGLDDGLLNKQQHDTLADQQSTGKTRVTGFGKNRDGTGGLPSGESIFGDAKNQAALRDAWTGKDQRKQELLKEIMEANAQGKLVSDGGFIASVSKPEYQSPLYRDSDVSFRIICRSYCRIKCRTFCRIICHSCNRRWCQERRSRYSVV